VGKGMTSANIRHPSTTTA